MSESTPEIDPRDNIESQIAEGEASQLGSRASDGGAIFSGARPKDSVPGVPDPADGDPTTGTQAGNPLAGVTISEQDAADAVPGDTGPELPGRR